MKKVWLLDKTEYSGQCTGFGEETQLIAVLAEKPNLQTIAPFLVGFLSADMGEAIPQVTALIDTGRVELKGEDFSLYQVDTGKKLNNE